MYVVCRRTKRSFELGDMVYLRFQPYRLSSLKNNGSEKLQPRSYGPYRITRRIGEVAYKLDLPHNNRIHNVFHVSCLKKAIGQHVVPSIGLPPLDVEGKLVLVPTEVIEVRERKLHSKSIKEYLIRWKIFHMKMPLGRAN